MVIVLQSLRDVVWRYEDSSMHYTNREGSSKAALLSPDELIRCSDYSRLSWPQKELKNLESPESGRGEEKEID